MTKDDVEALDAEVWGTLSARHAELKDRIEAAAEIEHHTGEYQLDRTPSPDVETAVPVEQLRALNEELLRRARGLRGQPEAGRQLERRREALGDEGGIDWGHAEALAYRARCSPRARRCA